MTAILAPVPAVVKPADEIIALAPEAYRVALEASYAAADLDESWIMSDAEADALADEAASYSAYESGLPLW